MVKVNFKTDQIVSEPCEVDHLRVHKFNFNFGQALRVAPTLWITDSKNRPPERSVISLWRARSWVLHFKEEEEVSVKVGFAHSNPLSLGAEWELQLIDSNTLDLSSSSREVLSEFEGDPKIQAEIFQSMIELTTSIHSSALHIQEDLNDTLQRVTKACNHLGLQLAAAGTHPFAKFSDGQPFPASRYDKIFESHQWIARRLLIFGLHIHVGMRDKEHAVKMMNGLLKELPLLLALSSSSPFLKGENTHLASCRSTFFESLPTGGHPYRFDSWAEYEKAFNNLIRSKSIRSHKDLWWDIRPSPHYGTLEIRICDSPATVSEAAALTALLHVLCQKLDQQIQAKEPIEETPDWVLRENKWRASRFGVGAELLVGHKGEVSSVKNIVRDILRSHEQFIEKSGYQNLMKVIGQIAQKGTSADRQRHRYLHGDLKTVIEGQIEELKKGSPIWTSLKKAV